MGNNIPKLGKSIPDPSLFKEARRLLGRIVHEVDPRLMEKELFEEAQAWFSRPEADVMEIVTLLRKIESDMDMVDELYMNPLYRDIDFFLLQIEQKIRRTRNITG